GSNYHKIEDDNLMSQIAADPRYRDSLMWVTNMEDVRDLVTQPDKTILVSHIPPKFDNVDNCVDFAHFCKINDGGIAPIFAADYFRAQGATVVEKKENRGNADLRKLIDDVGITKGVHNHFHESGHRANNLRSDSVKQGEFVDDLFYNSGSPDQGQCGIYSVRSDGKVAYKNISLS
ncbi:hypothetical protein HON01_10755, partial [Candidatus Woesearchaeota archaeon]|nr:hypothetical protein [Candidatus Woesearchaeota archaeon]